MDQRRPSSSSQSEAAIRGARAAATWRVCVVEDSYSTLRTIFSALKTRGHEVDHFSTGDDAYQALLAVDYSALIVGQTMGVGGLDRQSLIRKIRSEAPANKHAVPVVALAVNGEEAGGAALRAAGADSVLTALSAQALQDALAAAIAAAKVPEWRPLRICLLEDSYTRSLALCDTIAKQGHHVDHVALGEDALKALATGQYDVFLADHVENAGGFSLATLVRHAREIGASQRRPLHIGALSAANTANHMAGLSRLGVDAVVTPDQRGSYAASLEHALASFSGAARAGPAMHQSTSAPAPFPAAPSAPDSEPGFVAVRVDSGRGIPASAASRSRTPLWRRLFMSSLSVLMVVGMLAGLWASWQVFGEVTPVEVVVAREGLLTKSVNGLGRVVGKRHVDLASNQEGALYRVRVQEGERVAAGTVLATLDNREALVTVKRAEAEVFRLQTEISEAEKSFEFVGGAAHGADLAGQARRDLEAALASARARLGVAEQDLAAAELAVERLNITAPFAGLITQSFAVEGRWVGPHTPLFTLVDTDAREAVIQIAADDARDVAPGQSVVLSSDAAPGREWREKILRVASEETTTASGGRLPVVTVHASLGPSASVLPIGARVVAQIVTESSANAIKVPFETVFEQDGQQYVAVVDNERVHHRPVRLGIRALTEIEVLEGLALGEFVILPRDRLNDGQRVSASTVVPNAPLDEEGYPGRAKFPDVPFYTTEQLRKNYEQAIVVDVRSKFEFDVIHIEKAINVPVSADTFVAELERWRAKDGEQPLVFYCNGHSCMKSYEAARTAREAGFRNVHAYDSGIFDWLRDNREKATLLGLTPAPLDKLVSDHYFNGRLIDFDDFAKKATAENAVVIDVRDAMQRDTKMALDAVEVPLDEFIAKLDGNEFKGRQLLLFDAVGKQVRWLQYILEDRGYKDYFFLRDGIAGVRG